MFRTQANPMDEAVVKATDENLTSENWSYILDVCDQASATPSAPAQAIGSLIKRLAHRNANVQLYTLELANALSQNCGLELHRELASKAFTDALLRLAADRNTHSQVKSKVFERMAGWSEQFRGQAELGIMDSAYQKLKVQQPQLMPPSKPTKREISSEDRKKEDEELQMALALSIKDKGVASPANDDPAPSHDAGQAQAQPAGTTAATVSRVRALYDFTPSEPGELAFRKNDIIAVLESVYKDWWKGSLRGQTGIFPLNYVEKLQDPTKEELERDAQMESEVFAEIKNVEKLLALLSVGGEGGGRRGEREEDEISELYQRTLSTRPKLIELIARYSQKKDDFTQLNEKFIKARRDYEALLEASMSQPQYQQPYPPRNRPPHPAFPPHMQQPIQQGFNHPPPAQGYPPPQQAYPPQNQHHNAPPQQDPQRYYSPSPAEVGPPQTFSSGYPVQGAGAIISNGPAPFHFIPGGVHPPAPMSVASTGHDTRRTASPSLPPNEPFNPALSFQGQARPNSIHTLNSGNPQELATSGYESPIDNRHSYPTAQMIPAPLQPAQRGQPSPTPSQPYEAYKAPAAGPAAGPGPAPGPAQPTDTPVPIQPQHTAPLPAYSNDRDGLPSRQRTASLDTPSSLYSTQADRTFPESQPQASLPAAGPPPGAPSGAQGNYQAYQPYAPQPTQAPYQQQPQRIPPENNAAGDPGDYYR